MSDEAVPRWWDGLIKELQADIEQEEKAAS